MSSLRTAMARADEAFKDDPADEAYREQVVEAGYAAQDAISRALTVPREEIERQAREDEFASWAMEIIVRARQRIGRTKWSGTEGAVKRRIVEALRCLPSDD
jgi:hypothetical protein